LFLPAPNGRRASPPVGWHALELGCGASSPSMTSTVRHRAPALAGV